ncbi:PRC-barrel domain-containing protein [Cribrihabitans marinus]|uniref:PRC-barrel domain-containing protein n=1 Tax=Cribrihabitans marinus TaxID=1227549 RepID=A0A1H7DN85_9RHOB|nr:PRC-barrel domain-containing protein [Cribrihabitans marinus]SEK03229.1 PRC-barrel domain-containing protein [Cribrihabitans marinus]
MRMMTSGLAMACLLASAPVSVMAQTSDDSTQMPSAESSMTAESEPAPKPVEGQIVLQSEDSMLVRDLIGSTIYSPTSESVGDVNDVIVKLDGSVEGVVIGVGGFLGIGEKQVAVTMDQLELASFESGGQRLVLDATRADLEAAPAFKTAAEQKAEADVIEMENNTGTTEPAVNN